ncbi:MAG: O-antigen ligase family protein [Tenericutes bacterium]|jgi:O-antigen ligase|nr:O-antigen ligase family protein [Mycoplasmatota bacterium]
MTIIDKYDNIISMKNRQHINELAYFTIISGITFFIWLQQLDFLGMTLFVLASFFVLIFVKNTIHVVPFIFNMLFMISQTEWSLETIPVYLYLLPIILTVGFIIHYIRFRDKRITKGILVKPLLLMFLAIVLSIFNTEIFDLNYVFYLGIGAFYLLIYLFFVQTIKGETLDYLIKLFIVLGILISTQVLYYYISTGDVTDALRNNRVDLGWGISNFIATYLIMFITATIYYIKTKKYRVITVFIVAYEILMLIFTLSRGGVLSFIAIIPLLLYYLYHGQKNKKVMTLYLLLLLVLLVTVFVVRTDYLIPLFERFKELDLYDGSGRVELWRQAIEKFKEYPLFGAGLFARVEGDYFGFYHNTILHTLASLGIIGLVSLLWQAFVVIKVIFNKINLEKGILLIALIGANIHGMVDNVYFMPQFMIIFFVIVAAIEIYNDNQIMKPRIWRPENVKK